MLKEQFTPKLKIQSLYPHHKSQVKFFLVHKTFLELHRVAAFSKIGQGLVLKWGRTTCFLTARLVGSNLRDP